MTDNDETPAAAGPAREATVRDAALALGIDLDMLNDAEELLDFAVATGREVEPRVAAAIRRTRRVVVARAAGRQDN